MKKTQLHLKSGLSFLALTSLFCFSQPAIAQSAPAQDNKPVQDRDINRDELARFDQFLDSHREIAEQVRKDPSVVNKDDFVKNHPALQTFLREHPAIREQIKQNPDAFMHAENRYDRREDNRDRDVNRQELSRFDQFLDAHRETAEQLRKNPSLVNNEEYVKGHPELQAYLQDHPAVREQLRDNPNALMQAQNRDDRREDNRDADANRADANRDRATDANRDTDRQADNRDRDNRDRDVSRDRDTNRQELANFDRFLDSHRETAEQLRKDPSLVDNHEFVKNHPALQTYLQDHPAVRQEIKENPNAFMEAENRYDRREDDANRDRWAGADRDHRDGMTDHNDMHRHFGEFLNSHSDLAQRLSQNPALVKDHDFVESHPELKEYLNANPEARQQLMANPQDFVKSSQQFNANGAKPPAAEPKPHQ
ncbi:MAG TPA: hypothetical protein VGI46_00635 [Candidatus Acidoferrum sp.]